MIEEIGGLIDWAGYGGVALLMLAEMVFPPLPSEIIMPVAGLSAAQGRLQLWLVVLAGAAGSLAGALAWYWAARAVGARKLKAWSARHGRWLAFSPDEVDRSCRWFRRRGGLAVLFGRLAPTVRSLISLPAGIAEMPLGRFILYSALGSAGWCALLAGLGYALKERHGLVAEVLDPASIVVLVLLVLWYAWRVIRLSPDRGN
jgi:membrane protein DedA with SNARE-associated domain